MNHTNQTSEYEWLDGQYSFIEALKKGSATHVLVSCETGHQIVVGAVSDALCEVNGTWARITRKEVVGRWKLRSKF